MTEEPDLEIVSRWVQDFVDRLDEGWPDELESAINRLRHICRQRDIAILDGTKILLECGDAKTQAEDEKLRRIYYQNIVYEVCNLLDCGDLKTVCGTVETPSRGVQEALSNLIESSRYLYVKARGERDIEIERNDRLATENVELAAHLHREAEEKRNAEIAALEQEIRERQERLSTLARFFT